MNTRIGYREPKKARRWRSCLPIETPTIIFGPNEAFQEGTRLGFKVIAEATNEYDGKHFHCCSGLG